MKVVILGSGNVATVLGKLIREKGHTILQVMGRNYEHTRSLAAELGANFTTDFRSIDTEADICLVAVSDNALSNIHDWLQAKEQLVLHTAGSVSVEVLQKTSIRYGVLYPLQSLRAETAYTPEIPFLVDGNTKETTWEVYSFASSLSDKVSKANDAQRLKLHLAAVVSSNFINHLLTLTEAYCKEEEVDFKLLLPLLSETVNRIKDFSPAEVQTGPAIRNDQETMNKHLEMLVQNPELQELYGLFSQSIRKHYAIS